MDAARPHVAWPLHRHVARLVLAAVVVVTAVGCAGAGAPSVGTTGGVALDDPLDGAVPQGDTIVVSPDGDDAGTGGRADPLRTITVAIERAVAGDTILLRGGRYAQDVRIQPPPGTPGAPITLRAWPEEVPVIEGLVWLQRPHHWVVQDLEVTWRDGLDDDDHLVKVTGGVGWVLRRLHVHDARSYAAVLVASPPGVPEEPARWRMTDNCITDTHPTNETNQDHLVYVNSGTSSGPGQIDANVLVGAPNGVGVKLAGPEEDEGGASRVVVANNVIGDVVNGVLVGGLSSGNAVVGNRFSGIDDGGAAIRAYRLVDSTNTAARNVVLGGGRIFSDYDSPVAEVADEGGNRNDDGDPDPRIPACATGGTGLDHYARAW